MEVQITLLDKRTVTTLFRVLRQIKQYVKKQFLKGHKLPPVPGSMSGKLFTELTHNMFISLGTNMRFYLDTGRIIKFEKSVKSKMIGYVGMDWCPAGLSKDRKIFENLLMDAKAKNRTEVASLTDILLNKSSLFS